MRKFFFALLLLTIFPAASFAQTAQSTTTPGAAPSLKLMPMPSTVQPGTGELPITYTFSIQLKGYTEPRLERASARFMHELAGVTGLSIGTATADTTKPMLVATTDHASLPVQDVGEDESYTLDVTPTQATLHAANPLGTMHGLQTFLQLVQVTSTGFAAPAVHIEDTPRFPWRGFMFDSGRHFTPMDVLKRNIDGIEAVKLNVLHWHLSENQGFRVESKAFPKLTELGSDGLFYTQAEVKEIIEYAGDRGIRVMPEFDMPGHATAWFVGYPQIASGAGPYKIEREWGVFDPAMDPTNDATYKFLEKLLPEMTALFPDQFFHIGGDEVNGEVWTSNPRIASFMKRKGFEKPSQLQTYFSQRVVRIVELHGKKPIGWDEVLVPGLPKNVLVQSWRGVDSLAAGARQGYRGILSAPYYLDGMKTNETHYLADPIPADTTLTAEQQKLILGGEVCMWAEQLDERTIDSRIWPRTAVMAERFWSPQSDRDVVSMYRRLPRISIELELAGLKHMTGPALMRRSISGEVNPTALTTLAAVLEPVSFGERSDTQHTDSHTPLDRLVDTVVPDPPSRFEIAQDVDAVVNKTADSTAAEARLTRRFMEWQEIAPSLAAEMQQNPRMSDAAVRATQLGELGQIGLQALLNLDPNNSAYGGPKLRSSTPESQLAAIADAQKPAALVRFTFLDSLKKLVQAEK